MGNNRNKRLFRKGQRIELNIIDLAFGGKGIAKIPTEDGDFVCFLGPSGCGKTTLLRCIAGLETQSKGNIFQQPCIGL